MSNLNELNEKHPSKEEQAGLSAVHAAVMDALENGSDHEDEDEIEAVEKTNPSECLDCQDNFDQKESIPGENLRNEKLSCGENKVAENDEENALSFLDAADIPVPTELLRRDMIAPGAVGIPGMAATGRNESSRPRISVTGGTLGITYNDDENDITSNQAPPPLLTATLVEESNRDMRASSSTIVADAMRQTPLAFAEPMSEHLSEEKLKHQQEEPTIVPELRGKFGRLVFLIAAVVCCCMLTGIVIGVTLASIRDEDGEKEKGGPPKIKTGKAKQMYYFLQWGYFTAGCEPPQDALLQLSCGNEGRLEMIYLPENVFCEIDDNFERRSATCRLDETRVGGGGNSRHLQRRLTDNPIERRRRAQNVEGGELVLEHLSIRQGHIVAVCEGGKSDDDSIFLDAKVDLITNNMEEAIAKSSTCSAVWQERPLKNEVNRVDRVYGGGTSAFLSNTLLCPEQESQFGLELRGTTCAVSLFVGTQFSFITSNLVQFVSLISWNLFLIFL